MLCSPVDSIVVRSVSRPKVDPIVNPNLMRVNQTKQNKDGLLNRFRVLVYTLSTVVKMQEEATVGW